MNYSETPLLFSVAGEPLVGIAALPEKAFDCGVVVVVGGPQYRVGSHRQFLLLSRRLAEAGYPVFRFDYRGMGDSTGQMRNFESVSDDIQGAIDAFVCAYPQVKRVVLWGLCDAASAILLALQNTLKETLIASSPRRRPGSSSSDFLDSGLRRNDEPSINQRFPDERVAGTVLLNPWVRSEASLAQTHIKHYYGQRLMQPEFWRKLLSGKLGICSSLREFLRNAAKARGGQEAGSDNAVSFQNRMATGLRQYSGQTLLILSGQDYTAREFIDYACADKAWEGLLASPNVTRCDIAGADHTFSSAALRAIVENETLAWLERLRTGLGAY